MKNLILTPTFLSRSPTIFIADTLVGVVKTECPPDKPEIYLQINISKKIKKICIALILLCKIILLEESFAFRKKSINTGNWTENEK